VYKYTLAGSLLGSWTIDPANTQPTGITINPNNVSDIWIVDNGTDKVYQYAGAASRTSGSQSAAATFALAPGDTNPQGIADPPPASLALPTNESKVIPLSSDGGAPLFDAALISHCLSEGPTSGNVTSTNGIALASPMGVAASAGAMDSAEIDALLAVATAKQAHEGLADPFADDLDLWL
jgi:hypothetical protein